MPWAVVTVHCAAADTTVPFQSLLCRVGGKNRGPTRDTAAGWAAASRPAFFADGVRDLGVGSRRGRALLPSERSSSTSPTSGFAAAVGHRRRAGP